MGGNLDLQGEKLAVLPPEPAARQVGVVQVSQTEGAEPAVRVAAALMTMVPWKAGPGGGRGWLWWAGCSVAAGCSELLMSQHMMFLVVSKGFLFMTSKEVGLASLCLYAT